MRKVIKFVTIGIILATTITTVKAETQQGAFGADYALLMNAPVTGGTGIRIYRRVSHWGYPDAGLAGTADGWFEKDGIRMEGSAWSGGSMPSSFVMIGNGESVIGRSFLTLSDGGVLVWSYSTGGVPGVQLSETLFVAQGSTVELRSRIDRHSNTLQTITSTLLVDDVEIRSHTASGAVNVLFAPLHNISIPGTIRMYAPLITENADRWFTVGEAINFTKYDAFPSGVDATGQAISIDLVDAGGVRTNQFTGVVAPGTTGTIYTGSWPDADGNYLSGLAVTGNRIYQSAGSISVAPKSKLIITVGAQVTGNVGDTLSNQALTGHSTLGNNSSALEITDPGVTIIRSNHVTHRIEQGTTLRKWAYSNTPDANNPTVHSVGCPDSGNLLVPGTCLDCALGNARLQKDTVITYSLTMDNAKNLHKGSNLAGNIASGMPIPGGYLDNKHADVVIPEGFTVDPAALRVYVTDANGVSVPITNGSGTFSNPQSVNENGAPVTREVLSISGATIDIKDTGEGTNIFTLSNINLADNGTRWELSLDNRAYASGTANDYTGYSITYLFDATVTGEHDSVVLANDTWVNHWKQDNGNRVHNPEDPVVSAVAPASILSNSVVHARLSDAVDTLFTKVGANDITTGLAGAEFALYKWDGTNPPTTAQANHIVDTTVLIDTAPMPAGQWIRVRKNAAPATLTDIFISSNIPSDMGEVDLGKLPTGTYTLVETKAPAGYALPVGQWILTIDSDKGDTAASDWKIEIVGKTNSIAPPAAIRDESIPNAPTYKIVNAEPFLIGLSGLRGTTGMLLTGFVIMAVAGNTYLVWKHKRATK